MTTEQQAVARRNIPLIGTDIELGPDEWRSGVGKDLGPYEAALYHLGSKRKPTVSEYGQYHPDNVFAEIAPPESSSVSGWLAKYLTLKQHVEALMGIGLRGYDYVEIPDGLLSRTSFPHLYSLSRTFGCSPDLHAGVVRDVPLAVKRRSLREAGLHLHFQLPLSMMTGVHMTTVKPGVHMLMEQGGSRLQGVVNEFSQASRRFNRWDHPTELPWYRQPGTYRIKPYGIEYRSLGGSLLNDMEELTMLIDMSFNFLNDIWRAYQ